MAGMAWGLIEVKGLSGGYEAADAAVKAAGVRLIGYESSGGGGLVTIKVTGEVGAVTAAVEAAVAAAERVTEVYSKKIIPRPATGLDEVFGQETAIKD